MKTHSNSLCVLAGIVLLWAPGGVVAADGSEGLRIREVTAFKDGHAFVVQAGRAVPDGDGRVVLDQLPVPVLGTFWCDVTDPETRLISVVAEPCRVPVRRTALTLRELLEANIGAEVLITETNGATRTGTLLGFPTRSANELAATTPGSAGRLPQTGDLLLLETTEGTRALGVDRIQDVTFRQPPETAGTREEFRSRLTLNLSGPAGALSPTAGVGLMYLQRGIRWIPGYRVDLDGQGGAQVRLQATVLNELADLEDVTLHLVIGVPTFAFKETLDPMAMEGTIARLSAFFHGSTDPRRREDLLLSNFSNVFMSQAVRMGDARPVSNAVGAGDPELPEGTRNEDLYVFTVANVTLKQGARLVLPLAEARVPCEDVFTLEIPFVPPPELGRHLNSQQQADLARVLAAPRVLHRVRLSNTSGHPFTTAPALIRREGRVVAQGLMTYTAAGATTDLALTTAVDLQVRKSDRETGRTPNALQHNNSHYMRVDLAGTIRLVNHRDQPVRLEVTRHVLGHVTAADHDGKIAMSNVFESRDHLPVSEAGSGLDWWAGLNWPWWWHHLNPVGRIAWTLELEPGHPLELDYAWHYYWQ